jgi:hypothetical protein
VIDRDGETVHGLRLRAAGGDLVYERRAEERVGHGAGCADGGEGDERYSVDERVTWSWQRVAGALAAPLASGGAAVEERDCRGL